MRRLHLLLAVALVGCGGASESVVAIAPPQDAAVSDPGDGSQDATNVLCPSCEPTPVGPPIVPNEPNEAGSTDAAPNDGSSDGSTTDGSSEAGHTEDGECGEHHHREARIHHQHCHRTPAHIWRCR